MDGWNPGQPIWREGAHVIKGKSISGLPPITMDKSRDFLALFHIFATLFSSSGCHADRLAGQGHYKLRGHRCTGDPVIPEKTH